MLHRSRIHASGGIEPTSSAAQPIRYRLIVDAVTIPGILMRLD